MIPFLKKPWKHQEEACANYQNRTKYALFFDVGTGKTFTAINMLRQKYAAHGKILRTIILCPPIVISNWKREILECSKIKETDIVELKGPVHKRTFMVEDLIKSNRDSILITNYEGLANVKFHRALINYKAQAIVADESHRIKNPGAIRTRRTFTLGDGVPYRIILTGSPILRNSLDLWGQYRFLDSGETFGKNYTEFRAKYFYDANKGAAHISFPDWRPRKKMEPELIEKISATSMRVKKKDCLDLPPLIKKKVEVELSPDQRRVYNEMKDEFIAVMGSEVVTAQNALAKALRLQQIVSGHMPVEDMHTGHKKIAKFKASPRDIALRDLLANIAYDDKVIVWAVFRENYNSIRKICDELGLGYTEIHGGVSDKRRDEGVLAYNNDPNIRVCIGHPGSGGIGINLVNKLSIKSYSIFYSRNFSLEYDIQAEARNYRGGSEVYEKITRIDLVAKDTIDEHILDCLSQKKVISAKLLKDMIEDL